MYDPYAEFETTTLANGLRVHVHHKPKMSFAHLSVFVKTGMTDDSVEKTGLSHFLEHMICANTGMSLTERNLYFKEEGAEWRASTNWYRTLYGFSAPLASIKFQEFLDYWARALIENPISKYYDRERDVVRREIARKYPNEKVAQLVQTDHWLQFRGLPEGWCQSSLGSLESFESITHEDLIVHKERTYVPQNMEVVCVGGLSTEALMKMINETALSWSVPGSVRPPYETLEVVPCPIKTRHEGEISAGNRMGSATLMINALLPGSCNEKALRFLANYLGDKLVDRLREERGLLYSAGVSVDIFPGFFRFLGYANDFPESEVGVVEEIMREVLASSFTTEDEFEYYQKLSLASFLMRDDNLRKVHNYAIKDLVESGHIESIEAELERTRKARFADLERIKQFLVPEYLYTLVVVK